MSIITFRGDFLVSLIKSYVSYLNDHKSGLVTLYISMMVLIITTGITAQLTEALILTSGLMVIIHLNTNKVGKLLFFCTMNSVLSALLSVAAAYLLNCNISLNIFLLLTKLLLLILIIYYGLQKCSIKVRNYAAVISIMLICLSAVHSVNI